MLLSILGFYPILLSTCWWSAEDYYGCFLAEGRVLQSISQLSCHLLGLKRSIRFCLSFECYWWLRRTAVCAKYVMPSRILRVRMPCMGTFFWSNAGVLEIIFYSGLLFSVFATFTRRSCCCWPYPRRIVSFRYSCFLSITVLTSAPFNCKSYESYRLSIFEATLSVNSNDILSISDNARWELIFFELYCRFKRTILCAYLFFRASDDCFLLNSLLIDFLPSGFVTFVLSSPVFTCRIQVVWSFFL